MTTAKATDESDANFLDDMATYVYLAIRLAAALIVVWHGSLATR